MVFNLVLILYANLVVLQKYGSSQAVNTVICFAERKSSSDSDSGNDTQVALAKLYAHVQMMPNSSKKKKLLKQFNQASGTVPAKKHSRSKTLGEQIKVCILCVHTLLQYLLNSFKFMNSITCVRFSLLIHLFIFYFDFFSCIETLRKLA